MRRIHLPRAALFVSDHLTGARGSFRSSGCTRTTPGEAPAAPRRAAQHRAERPPTGRAGCFGVCGLVCKPQGRSTTTGLKYRPVPSHTATAADADILAPCATLAATSTPSCVSDPCPQQPMRLPFPLQWGTTDQRGGPNASTDADQLVARRSSDSAMDGGREERPEAAEASPNHAVHHAQAAQLCQPLASLSDSSLKQPTRAQRASGRASLSGEQARRARSRRLPGPGRARGVASPQHPPSFWPPPPPRSSPAAGHAPFNIAPRRRWADRRPYRRTGLPGAKAWWRVRRGDGPSARARPEGLPRLRSVAAAHRLPHTF